MSELEARYARGQETRRMFGGGTIGAGAAPGAWDVAPDLERILGEALFGTIWRREALSPVQREIITLSTLIVLAREPQLRQHLGNALHVGLTPEQLVELIIHATWYGGAPAGLNALTLCKEVVRRRLGHCIPFWYALARRLPSRTRGTIPPPHHLGVGSSALSQTLLRRS